MLRRRVTVGFIVCIALALPFAAAAGTADSSAIRETILPNGLKVLTKELRAAPVVTVWTLYRVGSRNERPGATGISHVLEHMLFRSTKSMKTGEIDRLDPARRRPPQRVHELRLHGLSHHPPQRQTGDRVAHRVRPDDELRARPRRTQDGARRGPVGAPGAPERPRGTPRRDHARHRVPVAPVSQSDHRLEGRRAVLDARGDPGLLPGPLSAEQRRSDYRRGHPHRGHAGSRAEVLRRPARGFPASAGPHPRARAHGRAPSRRQGSGLHRPPPGILSTPPPPPIPITLRSWSWTES